MLTVPCDDILLYISFFDFSFFSWMSHFGIVRYCDGVKGQVCAEVTAWGRHFLSIIE